MKQYDFARPIFGEPERSAVNHVMSGLWLASGQENAAFEKEFAAYIGVPYALCVNSGSSANLLALASLNLPKGSKVLTSACGFPATLSPILHLGLEPVLVDYDINTYNIDVSQVVEKIPDVKAILFAHTMGSPVQMGQIIVECVKHGVLIIEDCCEALGAIYYKGQVGGLGAMGTFSFYPSHQITALGGGGMITFNDEAHYRRAKSMRDWGKQSNWDAYGQNDTAYDTVVDGLDYFKHYAYETMGYNFKLPEANAAFGRVQMGRLDEFVESRSHNHDMLAQLLGAVTPLNVRHDVAINGKPSWFGVVMRTPERNQFGQYLEDNGIKHRPFFAGNITRHPPFSQFKKSYPVADKLMTDALFVGCHPGLNTDDIHDMATIIAGYWK